MLNTLILLIGDLFVAVFQGFYMGVGIRQSAGVHNILGMTVPTLIVWLALGFPLGVYRDVPNHEERAAFVPKTDANRKGFAALRRNLRNLGRLMKKSIESERLLSLAAVWLGTSAFAVLYQTWYWNAVLKAGLPFSIRFAIYFALFGGNLLILWRAGWTLFIAVRVFARKFVPIRVACYLITLGIVLFQLPAILLTVQYNSRRFTLENVETVPGRTAIVFGAGVYLNGKPSGVLSDRVKTAVSLYQDKKIDTILLSGDNSAESRHEVDVMAELSVELGVPEKALLRDNLGFSTIETCRNAAETFDLHEAALVTQDFHTTRALYNCDQFGLNAISVAADRASYNIFGWAMWTLRDWSGLTLSWLYFRDR